MEYISKYLHLIVAGMLVLCLLPMPYGFYALVRLASAVAFAWWAYKYYQKEKMGMMVTFIALALLFQPFAKVALGREVWNLVDVVVAAFLAWTWWQEKKTNKK